MTIVPRRWLVEKLVWTGHLNMEEREMLGTKTIKFSEVKDVIKAHFQNEKFFPPVKFSKPGQRFGYDGYIIEKVSDNLFKFHYQTNGPLGDFRGREVTGEADNIDTAIEVYYEHANDIDGIKIEKD